MADISSNLAKMNDLEIAFDASLSEQLMNKIGANINGLIDISGNVNFFTAGDTLDIPEGITEVFTLGCGGGGGGAGGFNGAGGATLFSSQGGSSALLYLNVFSVTELETLTIAIGSGGAGGAAATVGSAGTNTTVTGLAGTLTYFGAPGGLPGNNTAGEPGGDLQRYFLRSRTRANFLQGEFYIADGAATATERVDSANFTSAGGSLSTARNGGAGASSDFGPGGGSQTTLNTAGNAPAATSYGAGGGAGDGTGVGAAGADGALYIFW